MPKETIATAKYGIFEVELTQEELNALYADYALLRDVLFMVLSGRTIDCYPYEFDDELLKLIKDFYKENTNFCNEIVDEFSFNKNINIK